MISLDSKAWVVNRKPYVRPVADPPVSYTLADHTHSQGLYGNGRLLMESFNDEMTLRVVGNFLDAKFIQASPQANDQLAGHGRFPFNLTVWERWNQ